MNSSDLSPSAPCAVIIVTHHSQHCLDQAIEALKNQTALPTQIIIIDSGSSDTAYLERYKKDSLITLHLTKKNVGFCVGNNLGLSYVDKQLASFVLFLNPDTFLFPRFLEMATEVMLKPESAEIGALSGILLGYDLSQKSPNGRIDSTGIFQSWVGKWYDRHQGTPYPPSDELKEEPVPALCGALMFCRLEALHDVELAPSIAMDPSFFMYKEDIDLSLRMRRKGWKILFHPQLKAYHCRGWQKNRLEVPRSMRLLSAKNEIRLHYRFKSPYLLYSLLKYAAVKLFNF